MQIKTTIAIVDDNEEVRETLAAQVQSAGHAVRTFGTGQEFLSAVDFTALGCAILDVRMPGLSGLEVLEQISTLEIAPPIIMVTGHGDIPMAVQALRAGAIDFIEKPFRRETILASIQRALDIGSGKSRDEKITRGIVERVFQLTARERQVLDHLILGQSNKNTAIELGISPRTVEIHRARIMQKMQARNLADLVRMVLASKLDRRPHPALD